MDTKINLPFPKSAQFSENIDTNIGTQRFCQHEEIYIWNRRSTKTTQKTRRHVGRLMTSPHVPVVNVKYAQKHKQYKITLSTYVLMQLSCDTVFFAIKNIKIS